MNKEILYFKHGGSAGRRRARRDAGRKVRPEDKRPSYPQVIEETS